MSTLRPGYRYLPGVVTLELDVDKCNGCRVCPEVCPRGVLAMNGNRAEIVDRDACIECGACALNCQPGALTVDAGVGCAAAIIRGWLTGGEPTCDCKCQASSGPASTARRTSHSRWPRPPTLKISIDRKSSS